MEGTAHSPFWPFKSLPKNERFCCPTAAFSGWIISLLLGFHLLLWLESDVPPPFSSPPPSLLLKIALRTNFFFMRRSTHFHLIQKDLPRAFPRVDPLMEGPRLSKSLCRAALSSKSTPYSSFSGRAFILLLGLICHYFNTVTLKVRCQKTFQPSGE